MGYSPNFLKTINKVTGEVGIEPTLWMPPCAQRLHYSPWGPEWELHPHSFLAETALLVMLSEPFTKYLILFELASQDHRDLEQIQNHRFDLVSGLDF